MSRKLAETRNIITLYRHHVGMSEVPIAFHNWAVVSLIAACVADRIYFRKFKSSKLYPNMFTLLLGPSGCGKGEAVAQMMQYAKELPIVGAYAGNTTAQYLFKILARRTEADDGTILSGGKLFLVLEELSMNVGEGPLAIDFVRHLTGLYKGGEYPIEKGTVTGGHVTLKDHLLNVLIGTNLVDAVQCIPRSAIQGGFLGRVAVVEGVYDPKVRITRPQYPRDCDEITERLHERFRLLTQYEGEFQMTTHAARMEEHWYTTRPVPEDENMMPTWKREHDLCLKLAMIVALAEIGPDDPLLIKGKHMEQAQQLTEAAHRAAPKLQYAANQSKDSEHLELVRRICEKAGTIHRSALQRKLSARGMLKDRMDEALATLVTEGVVRAMMDGRSMAYTFLGRRILG